VAILNGGKKDSGLARSAARVLVVAPAFAALVLILGVRADSQSEPKDRKDKDKSPQKEWAQHDMNRPQPAIVEPGTPSTPERPGRPPSDAKLLFDGTDLAKWESAKDKGQAAPWKVAAGAMEVVKGTGDIQTKESFGDCQLHVEWATPTISKGSGQDRGNSGIFLMGIYEVQVLDSYQNKTYADGQAGAIYGQFPPLVNASRPQGKWQQYDIVFQGPRFAADGKVTRPARMTIFYNGVLVQLCRELIGPTANKARPPYAAHPDKLPLKLQDHEHPVRYRNIWIRELPDEM
jgi:hypothetical protein